MKDMAWFFRRMFKDTEGTPSELSLGRRLRRTKICVVVYPLLVPVRWGCRHKSGHPGSKMLIFFSLGPSLVGVAAVFFALLF